MEHPRVAGVGVVGVRIDDASRIAAYVICTGDAPADDALADELRAWCKERMRRYEYPHLIRFVDDLLRTLTGKVQRFRLREWAKETAAVEPAAEEVEDEADDVEVEETVEPDTEETDDSASTSGAAGQATECGLTITAKSGTAAGDPCLTTESFMRSINLTDKQIARVQKMATKVGVAH